MKCLVIHGSPRRGNTWNVLNLTKEEMKKNGEIEFEDIELRKEDIPPVAGVLIVFIKGKIHVLIVRR